MALLEAVKTQKLDFIKEYIACNPECISELTEREHPQPFGRSPLQVAIKIFRNNIWTPLNNELSQNRDEQQTAASITQVQCDILAVIASYSDEKDKILALCSLVGHTAYAHLPFPPALVLPLVSRRHINDLLIRYQGSHMIGVLHSAAEKRHYALLETLVAHGANVDLPDKAGLLPLERLCDKSDAPAHAVRTLASRKGLEESAALTLACMRNTHNVEVLLEMGASANYKDLNLCGGQLPLHVFLQNDILHRTHERNLLDRLIPRDQQELLEACTSFFMRSFDDSYPFYRDSVKALLRYLQPVQYKKLLLHVTIYSTPLQVMRSIDVCADRGTHVVRRSESFQATYLTSRLLAEMYAQIAETPENLYLHSSVTADDRKYCRALTALWADYRTRRNGAPIPLKHLVLKHIRQLMTSHLEEDYANLPLPSAIKKQLTYEHVAEVICNDWKLWPNTIY